MIHVQVLREGRFVLALAIILAFFCTQSSLRTAFSIGNDNSSIADNLKRRPLESKDLRKELSSRIVSNPESVSEENTLNLAETLFRRNKRDPLARLVIANNYLAKDDVQAYGDWFFPLFTVDRKNTSIYANELAVNSQNPQIFDLVLDKLKTNPPWGGPYVAAVSDLGFLPEQTLMRLYKPFPKLQSQILRKFIEDGKDDAAYQGFLYFLGTSVATIPFDPYFKGSNAPLPFNWFANSSYAEFNNEGGLYASYFGTQKTMMARQFLPLKSGSYRFLTSASGSADRSSGQFVWNIRCIKSGALIATLPLDSLKTASTDYRVNFIVPSQDCRLQTLSLEGLAGQFPKSTYVNLTSAEIEVLTDQETDQ